MQSMKDAATSQQVSMCTNEVSLNSITMGNNIV